MPELWSAHYIPALIPGKADPSKNNFSSEAEAVEYVFNQMCPLRKAQRGAYLDGVEGVFDPDCDPELLREAKEYPSCFYEWVVLPTETMERCENHEDLMSAVGWKTIYRSGDPEFECQKCFKSLTVCKCENSN